MSKATDAAYEMILTGQLRAGDQVKEEQVAERTGRTPVREAMRRLQSELFIHRTENQRSFVNSLTADAIWEVFALAPCWRSMSRSTPLRAPMTRS